MVAVCFRALGFGPLLLNNLFVQMIFDMIQIQGYTVDMVTWDFLPLLLIKGLGAMVIILARVLHLWTVSLFV